MSSPFVENSAEVRMRGDVQANLLRPRGARFEQHHECAAWPRRGVKWRMMEFPISR